jgi:hypothetical protein
MFPLCMGSGAPISITDAGASYAKAEMRSTSGSTCGSTLSFSVSAGTVASDLVWGKAVITFEIWVLIDEHEDFWCFVGTRHPVFWWSRREAREMSHRLTTKGGGRYRVRKMAVFPDD